MYLELTISSQAPSYDPEEFKAFCISAGANTIFDTVLAAMTTERHSEDRVRTNQQRTVAILYTLCFGLTQVCNWLQTDNAIFLHHSNLTQHGLDTVRQNKWEGRTVEGWLVICSIICPTVTTKRFLS